MGKTIITSTGNSLDSIFDRRFGRAEWFCVFDDINKNAEFVKNASTSSGHGAGTSAAETVAGMGVSRVISGDFGPKARDILEKLGIQMVIIDDEDSSVGEILERIK